MQYGSSQLDIEGTDTICGSYKRHRHASKKYEKLEKKWYVYQCVTSAGSAKRNLKVLPKFPVHALY